MKHRFLIVLLLLFTTTITNAQTDTLFGENEIRHFSADSMITGTMRTRYTTFNPAALERRDTLTLNLFVDATYTAVNEHIEPRPSGKAGYVWVGSMPGQPYSSVVLIIGESRLYGQVNLMDTAFAIETIQPGIVAISEVDGAEQHGSLDDDGIPVPPALFGPQPRHPLTGTPNTTRADSGSMIDVMVIYTAAAATASQNETISYRIDQMVAATNTTYAESGVNQRLRLVHTQQMNYTEYTLSQAQAEGHSTTMRAGLYHLTFLQGENDGFGNIPDPKGRLDSVHTLRDNYRADLVVLLTLEEQFNACGLGWVLSNNDPALIGYTQKYGFSVVDIRCWSPYFTFAHELGHNMGGMHDRHNAGSFTPVYPYAYGYQDRSTGAGDYGDFVTIMAYPMGDQCPSPNNNWAAICTPIGRWSNPAQTYNGKPLGMSSPPTNMVQTLNNTAYTVANFRFGMLDAFQLIAPADGSSTTDPFMTFEWEDVNEATTYKLIVTTPGGYSYRKTIMDADACNATTCSFSPLEDTTWKPPLGQTLRWKIKAIDSNTERSRTSARWKLFTAFLPPTITHYQPADRTTVNTIGVEFQWQYDTRVDEYRLTLIDPNGSKVYNGWHGAAGLCTGDSCMLDVDMTNLATRAILNGTYKWRVTARRAAVAGNIKSAASRFVFAPTISLTSPDHNAMLNNATFQLEWAELEGMSEYRVVLIYPGGVTNSTAWQSANTVCTGGMCTIPNPDPAASSAYQWRVQARDNGIKGKPRSPKRSLSYTTP